MSPIWRAFISCMATLVSVPLLGLAAFVAMSNLFRCSPEHPQCDLPDMAAFGLACIIAPCLGSIVGWQTWRRLARATT
jgi:hypothetical protein